MSKEKALDCVEMKNRIQADLLQAYEGMTAEEERQARRRKLAAADSPAARIWQSALMRRQVASR